MVIVQVQGDQVRSPRHRVRDATRQPPLAPADLAAVRDIHAYHVLHGLGSFEEAPPDLAEVGRRRDDVLVRSLPYLITEAEECVAGCARACPYRTRPAYHDTVEDSVQVAPDHLARVLALCEAAGCRQTAAVIGDGANVVRIELHSAFGCRRVSGLPSVAFNFGHRVDCVLMRRPLGAGDMTGGR